MVKPNHNHDHDTNLTILIFSCSRSRNIYIAISSHKNEEIVKISLHKRTFKSLLIVKFW